MGYFIWRISSEFHQKNDYFHLFDYWRWDEDNINSKLVNEYDWDVAPDTSTTWRIGDGTAAFYNYVYYTVAGFTEHDTFRSNQIREGQLSRKRALELVNDENQPRYQNIRWYLDTLGMDFVDVIGIINKIPKCMTLSLNDPPTLVHYEIFRARGRGLGWFTGESS